MGFCRDDAFFLTSSLTPTPFTHVGNILHPPYRGVRATTSFPDPDVGLPLESVGSRGGVLRGKQWRRQETSSGFMGCLFWSKKRVSIARVSSPV
ncbi:hypothetical protein E2C01_033277 [Portunus trituberculatus]|uniref:Uncharacterized protein n=1 Tax=Portunus trituberculatus TaxID=210409 RepID=A0A5B7F3B8_PORTR|nr:hypothetical protein [Portunus trituberculatus]